MQGVGIEPGGLSEQSAVGFALTQTPDGAEAGVGLVGQRVPFPIAHMRVLEQQQVFGQILRGQRRREAARIGNDAVRRVGDHVHGSVSRVRVDEPVVWWSERLGVSLQGLDIWKNLRLNRCLSSILAYVSL